MPGSPTSATCCVLVQVWDRRTKNAGSEMVTLNRDPIRSGDSVVDGPKDLFSEDVILMTFVFSRYAFFLVFMGQQTHLLQ